MAAQEGSAVEAEEGVVVEPVPQEQAVMEEMERLGYGLASRFQSLIALPSFIITRLLRRNETLAQKHREPNP